MTLKIFTDGGSRGNPGESAIGVVVRRVDDTPLFELGKCIGVGTNNRAEYLAVIEALTWLQEHARDHQVEQVSFFLDSLLVVEQINGRFKIKHPDLIPLKQHIDELRTSLPFSLSFSHVPRAQNARADALVNQALDTARS